MADCVCVWFQYVERHDLADVFQLDRRIVAPHKGKREGHEQTTKKATETKASDTIMVIDSEEGSKDQAPAAVASADHAVVAQSSEPATSTASNQEEEGQDARLSSQQPVSRSVLDVLRSEDYLQLSAAERLEVLRFLIDEVLQTDSFWYMLLAQINYYFCYLLYVFTASVITTPHSLSAGTTRTTRKRSCWLSRQSSGRRNERRKGRSESLRTRTRPLRRRRARRARTFSLAGAAP
jgi:hypothetical protein